MLFKYEQVRQVPGAVSRLCEGFAEGLHRAGWPTGCLLSWLVGWLVACLPGWLAAAGSAVAALYEHMQLRPNKSMEADKNREGKREI